MLFHRPVDVSARENVVAERLEREREAASTKTSQGHAMSRNTSRTGSQRGTQRGSQSPAQPASVRPSFSFAAAAGGNKVEESGEEASPPVKEVTEQLGEVTI